MKRLTEKEMLKRLRAAVRKACGAIGEVTHWVERLKRIGK